MKPKAIISFISRIDSWRATHVSERMFVLILAFLVGLLSAVAAFVLSLAFSTCSISSTPWWASC